MITKIIVERDWVKEKLTEYFHPMLVEDGSESDFGKEGWIAELKCDGTRAIAERIEDGFNLYGRRGLTYTETITEVTEQLIRIPQFFRLDGEIVYIDKEGHQIFSGSQKRCQVSNPEKVREYKKLYPVGYYVFDVVMLNNTDLTSYPYIKRRKILEYFVKLNNLLYDLSNIRLVPYSLNHKEIFSWAIQNGLEGIVMKNLLGKYEGGVRSKNALRVKRRDHSIFTLANNGKVSIKV